MTSPYPWTIFTKPGGNSISSKIFPNILDEIGQSSGGFITMVFPTTKLTATDLANNEIG